MAKNLAARQQSGWKVIGMFPDVCKTPMGSSVVPVPYPVYAELKDATDVVESVRFNGYPTVVFNQTHIPKTIGDKAGHRGGTVCADRQEWQRESGQAVDRTSR